MRRIAWLVIALCAGSVCDVRGHEVHHDVGVGEAVVVTLRYADGTPFAYEEAEVRTEGSPESGFFTRSDADGRVVFVPEGEGPWIVRVFSADGHGAEVRVDPATVTRGDHASGPASPLSGLFRVGFGVLLILGLFTLLAQFTRSRRSAGGHDHA